jgi:hypothetical protein
MAVRARNEPAVRPTGRSERHLRLVEAVGNELRHLHDVEEQGDTGGALFVLFLQVFATVLVLFAVLVTLAYAFYFGWL